MPSRLEERLAAREAAIIREVIAQTSSEGTIISSSVPPIAPDNSIIHHASPSSTSTAPQVGASRVDADPRGAVDVQDVAEDTDFTVAEINVMSDVGEVPGLALTSQPSVNAVNMEAVVPSLVSTSAISIVNDLVRPAVNAEQGPSAALSDQLSPLAIGSSESFSATANPRTGPRAQTGNNFISTPESMNSAEQAPTQERRARPQRAAAAKAVGKYVQGTDIDVNVNMMKDSAQIHLAVQTPPKTPVKRKRYIRSGATNATSSGSMNAEIDSDHHTLGKPTRKKQKPSSSGS